MKELMEKCEELEVLNIPGYELNEKDGVFELLLGSKGTYVINKQAPNRQLWWSSPVSGPKRYNYDVKQKAWRNSRDGHYLYDLFNEEITSLIGTEFDIYTIAHRPSK
jgi:frataxin